MGTPPLLNRPYGTVFLFGKNTGNKLPAYYLTFLSGPKKHNQFLKKPTCKEKIIDNYRNCIIL